VNWPLFNACMNATASVLLVSGFVAIKRDLRERHALLMRSAFVASAVFLAGYLYYHFAVLPDVGHTPFRREGAVRTVYYGMLISHIVLSAVLLPLVLRTLWMAHRERWESHKRWARWTFPIWLYVSVTGVLVYLALYHWNPAAPVASGG
jgi:putative membrane protein